MVFEFKSTKISVVVEIKPLVYGVNHGYFVETYKALVFEAVGIPTTFFQDNETAVRKAFFVISTSKNPTLRENWSG